MKQKLLIFLMLVLPQMASAYDFMVDELCYNYNDDGISVTVTYEIEGDCSYLNLSGNIIIPSSINYNGNTYTVNSIGQSAFYNCTALTSVTIPNSVTEIGYGAFSGCSGLTSLAIPNSVASIGSATFSDCSGLTSVSIPNSVTSIGSATFYNCTSLTSIDIPSSVTEIAINTFYRCTSLTSVTIPNSVTSIGSATFYNCTSLTSIDIPSSVTSIGSYAFYNCSGLTSVIIPNLVTSIGSNAFCNCNGLTSLIWNAKNCSSNGNMTTGNLEQATIGNTVEILPENFVNNSKITEIIIPSSVTSIGRNAFSNCNGLASLVVESDNTKYDSRDNCNAIIEKETNTLIAGCKNTIIPNSVTSIGEGAFRGCTSLTSVTIPNSTTKIDTYAFSNCSGLISIDIPNSITSIGFYAFYNCTGLTSLTWNAINCFSNGDMSTNNIEQVTIGDNVKVLPARFISNSKITSVTIPKSVTRIENNAFSGCNKLRTITSKIEDPESVSYGSDVFQGVSTNYCKLYVPSGKVEDYQFTAPWSDFLNILEEGGSSGGTPVYGDVNGDGAVTAADVTAIYNILLGVEQ